MSTPIERANRKIAVGRVVSDKMNKTRTIAIDRTKQEREYGKVLYVRTKVYAHDEENKSHVGDKVRIMETRKVSKNKSWRILEILDKTKS